MNYYGSISVLSMPYNAKLKIVTEKGVFILTHRGNKYCDVVVQKGWPLLDRTTPGTYTVECRVKLFGWGRVAVGRRLAFLCNGDRFCVTTKVLKFDRVWLGD